MDNFVYLANIQLFYFYKATNHSYFVNLVSSSRINEKTTVPDRFLSEEEYDV